MWRYPVQALHAGDAVTMCTCTPEENHRLGRASSPGLGTAAAVKGISPFDAAGGSSGTGCHSERARTAAAACIRSWAQCIALRLSPPLSVGCRSLFKRLAGAMSHPNCHPAAALALRRACAAGTHQLLEPYPGQRAPAQHSTARCSARAWPMPQPGVPPTGAPSATRASRPQLLLGAPQ